ncbi:MAG: hypothetical protein WCT01_03260 [Candidatus Shapirobacteria bacterium]
MRNNNESGPGRRNFSYFWESFRERNDLVVQMGIETCESVLSVGGIMARSVGRILLVAIEGTSIAVAGVRMNIDPELIARRICQPYEPIDISIGN